MKIWVVIDKHDSNFHQPFIGLYDDYDKALELADQVNSGYGNTYRTKLCYVEEYELNQTTRRAIIPKGSK